jgi:hypothetical protein
LKFASNENASRPAATIPNGARIHAKCPVYRLVNLGSGTGLACFLVLLVVAESRQGPAGALSMAGYKFPHMCLYRAVTGRACPGCGLIRGLAVAAHGDMRQAKAVHPSAPWVLAWCVSQLLLRVALAAFVPRPQKTLWIADSFLSSATFACAAYGPVFLR